MQPMFGSGGDATGRRAVPSLSAPKQLNCRGDVFLPTAKAVLHRKGNLFPRPRQMVYRKNGWWVFSRKLQGGGGVIVGVNVVSLPAITQNMQLLLSDKTL